MNRRDQAAAADAVNVLLSTTSAELRKGASATLASLGIDEHTALVEAREARKPTGTLGALRKDAAAGEIAVRAQMGGGRTVSIEMSPAEAVSLVGAVQDQLSRRGVQWH